MDDKQNRIIIFCQAPADVQYVLFLYEKFKTYRRISIFVINLEGIYNYFQSLKLNLQDLIFIPYPKNVPLKDLIELKKIKKQLKIDYRKYFENLEGLTVYFFSKYFDWLTAYFVSGISKTNKVFIIDHSRDTFTGIMKISGPLITYRKLVYRYLTSINFRFLKMQSTMMLEFPYKKFNIEDAPFALEPSVITKYRVTTETNKVKSILLFENNQSDYDFYSDYELTMTSIVELFRESGYIIFLKPHPRQGFSEFLKPFIESILPAEIPGEFFNPDDFSMIVGIDTNAIAFFAKNYQSKTLSLLELFNFKREEEKERYRQTQLLLSGNKINFIPSIYELKKLIA